MATTNITATQAPENSVSTADEAREVINEVFDDPEDREVIEAKLQAIADKLSDNPVVDAVLSLAVDAAIKAYHATGSGAEQSQ